MNHWRTRARVRKHVARQSSDIRDSHDVRIIKWRTFITNDVLLNVVRLSREGRAMVLQKMINKKQQQHSSNHLSFRLQQ